MSGPGALSAVRGTTLRAARALPPALWQGSLLVILGSIATWATWRFFVASATGQRLDEAAFSGARIGRRTLWQAAEPVLEIVSVPLLVGVLAVAAVLALARRRWVLLLQVGLVVGGANLTTQVLKHAVLERPDLVESISLRANSLPSGHTTVAASVAVALVLVVPRSWRPVTAVLGGIYAATTGVSTLIGAWHRPSDVIAAFAVVLAWAGAAAAVGALAGPDHPDDPSTASRAVAVLLGAGGLVAGALGTVGLLRTYWRLGEVAELTSRTDLAAAYVGSALGVVAAGACLLGATLMVSQAPAGSRTGDRWGPPER